MLRFPWRITAFAAVAAVLGLASSVRAATFAVLDSDAGDYIGGGVHETLNDEAAFGASPNYDSRISVSYHGVGGWIYFDFAAPQGQPLAPGAYEGAVRFPFQGITQPGLSVYGNGRGCNTLTGRFVVHEAVISNGVVERFAVDFEQH